MKKLGNVLSLFDGMSGAQQALNRAGVCFENYYSCEIDKFCNQVVSANFPKTVQLGDVTKVSGCDLPKIDLICVGSPCQGFSFAGKMLNFSDPRSALFFEAVRILNECRAKNPNILFLFENVRMKLEYELVFTKYLGVEPILINSALLCAQNRNRLYWTNIGAVPSNLFGDLKTTIQQPKDKGIFLRDILEIEVDKKYYLSGKAILRITNAQFNENKRGFRFHKGDKAKTGMSELGTLYNNFACKIDTVTTSHQPIILINVEGPPKSNQNKSSCFTAGGNSGGNHSDMDLLLEKRVIQINPCKKSGGKQPQQQDRIYDENGISPALMAQLSSGSNYILQRPRGYNKGNTFAEKSPPITCNSWEQNNTLLIRRLTPREVCRLQTVDYDSIFVHNGVQIVSDTQIYKMCGNGFNIDTIVWLLSHIK